MERRTPASSGSLWLRMTSLGLALAGSFSGATGCVHDEVLPVDQLCGNGIKEGTEECDLRPSDGGLSTDTGCVACHIAPGFTCDDTKCTSTCGDGQVAVGVEDCDPPDLMTCDSSCHSGSKTEDCDMNGYWIARETAFSIDNLLNEVQTTSHWHIFKITQTGGAFQIDKHIDCGVLVTGSATVQMTDKGVQNLMYANVMDTDTPPPRLPRKGTFTLSGGACVFAMDRHYNVRGVDEATFLPTDFLAKPDLSTLTPLPYETDPTNPTGANLAGQVDQDQDGNPGIAYILSGTVTGSRHVAQRDWVEYFTDPTALVPTKALEFAVRTDFDDQENILLVNNCPTIGCGLLVVGAHAARNMKNRATLRYLGKDMTDPRVSRILTQDLKVNPTSDFQSCLNARASLVHDPAKQ